MWATLQTDISVGREGEEGMRGMGGGGREEEEEEEMYGCYTLKPPLSFAPLHLSIPHLPDELLVLLIQLCQRVLVHHLPQLLQIRLSKLVLRGEEEKRGRHSHSLQYPCTQAVCVQLWWVNHSPKGWQPGRRSFEPTPSLDRKMGMAQTCVRGAVREA